MKWVLILVVGKASLLVVWSVGTKAALKDARWVELLAQLMENSKAVKMVDCSDKTLVVLLVAMMERQSVE